MFNSIFRGIGLVFWAIRNPRKVLPTYTKYRIGLSAGAFIDTWVAFEAGDLVRGPRRYRHGRAHNTLLTADNDLRVAFEELKAGHHCRAMDRVWRAEAHLANAQEEIRLAAIEVPGASDWHAKPWDLPIPAAVEIYYACTGQPRCSIQYGREYQNAFWDGHSLTIHDGEPSPESPPDADVNPKTPDPGDSKPQ